MRGGLCVAMAGAEPPALRMLPPSNRTSGSGAIAAPPGTVRAPWDAGGALAAVLGPCVGSPRAGDFPGGSAAELFVPVGNVRPQCVRVRVRVSALFQFALRN